MLDMLSELIRDHAKPILIIAGVCLVLGAVIGVQGALWVFRRLAERALRVQQAVVSLSRKYRDKDHENPEE